MKKNNLPSTWVVFDDGSQLFKDTVIKYLDDKYGYGKSLIGIHNYYGELTNTLWVKSASYIEHNFPQYKITLAQFIELSKPINMIDFKVKGTKLPIIPSGTEYIPGWTNHDKKCQIVVKKLNFISYGHTTYNKEVYILAEYPEYTAKGFFMIRESDIIQLAEEQGMFKNNTMEKKLIGYKCPMDLFKGNVIKGTLYKSLIPINMISYGALSKTGYLMPESFNMPREIVETWEAVYELEEPSIEVNGYKAKFEEGKVKFGCASFHIGVFRGLNSLIEHIDNEKCPIGQNTSKNIENVTLGKGTFTRDQIKQIVEFYDAKFTE